MSKQDRQGVRNATDLERKYQFGKSFAEVMGIARDAQTKAEEAKQSIDGLTPEQIFNILTDNGKSEGVYRGDDGQIYINASYIKGGTLVADFVKLSESNYSHNYIGDWQELHQLVTHEADAMPISSRRIFGFRMEVPEFHGFCILELAVGLNQDNMREAIARLYTGDIQMFMTGVAEDSYLGKDDPGELFWGEWAAVGGDDYIVEQGTTGFTNDAGDGSWTYRKWNSGLVELWGKSPEYAYGALGYQSYLVESHITNPWVFPFALSEVINTEFGFIATSGSGVWSYGEGISNTGIAKQYITRTLQAGVTGRYTVKVIGRWKG